MANWLWPSTGSTPDHERGVVLLSSFENSTLHLLCCCSCCWWWFLVMFLFLFLFFCCRCYSCSIGTLGNTAAWVTYSYATKETNTQYALKEQNCSKMGTIDDMIFIKMIVISQVSVANLFRKFLCLSGDSERFCFVRKYRPICLGNELWFVRR